MHFRGFIYEPKHDKWSILGFRLNGAPFYWTLGSFLPFLSRCFLSTEIYKDCPKLKISVFCFFIKVFDISKGYFKNWV